MCSQKKNNACSVLKVILIVIGAVAAVAGIVFVLCKIFKKYFTIEFECEDCENCDTPCFEEPDDEPECCDAEDGTAEAEA